MPKKVRELKAMVAKFHWQEFHTHGKTYEEAAKNGQEVIEAFIEMLQEEGKPLPEPTLALQ